MFSILLVSHGDIAREFINTCELIAGKQNNIEAISFYAGEDGEDFQEQLAAAAHRLYSEDGLLVLTDLYGATPCNLSIISLLNKYEGVEILSGLNLSMLLQAIMDRTDIRKSVNSILSAGWKGIIDVREQMLLHSK